MPLISFIFGVLISFLARVIVFAIHPAWKINSQNLILFVIGSSFMTVVLSLIYPRTFAAKNGMLQTSVAVLGYFGVLVVSIVGGGILSTYIGRKLFNREQK